MEANAHTIRKILHSGDQYLIPFFQRNYKWSRQHWERLRTDIWVLANEEVPSHATANIHFLGPMVCTAIHTVPGQPPAYQLIDGQQRLTTLTVLLAALRDVSREKGEEKLANKIHDDCLVHRNEEDLQRYKVVPRIGDRDALIGVIEGDVAEEFRRYSLVQAWKFFQQHIRRFVAKGDPAQRLQRLFSVIADQLSLVVITLNSENPYEIFESLNSTGLPLAEADLIRNYLFMQIDLDKQQQFHDAHWKPYEKMFDQTADYPAVNPTLFYRNYLMRGGSYARAKTTFLEFKQQHTDSGLTPQQCVDDLRRYAKFELYLRRPATHPDADIARSLAEIDLLEITTAHPLLLNLLQRHDRSELSSQALLNCLADLSSFVLRRSICGESTRAYGRWFVEAIKTLRDDPVENLRGYWANRGWPDDAAFSSRLIEFPVYRRESKKCRLMLDRLEFAANPKESPDASQLTIEHVMPQSVSDSPNGHAWQKMLGDDWQEVHDRWLHTIGNLSLTGYNLPLGNRPFAEKRIEFSKSNVTLNRAIAKHETWNDEAISLRGEELASTVSKIWPRPVAQPYVPPSDDEGDEDRRKKYQQRRIDYWSDLARLLDDQGKVSPPLKITSETSIDFPTEIENVSLWAWLVRVRTEVTVGISFKRRAGHKLYAALSADKGAVDKQFGQALTWADYGVSLARPSSRIIDEDDWFDQHEWLADTLAKFYEVLIPKVRELVDAGIGDTGSPRGANAHDAQREAFWDALEVYRAGTAAQYKLRNTGSQSSRDVSFGSSRFGVKVWCYPERRLIGVRLKGFGKKAADLVTYLKQERDRIEAALGPGVFRKGKRGSPILQLTHEANINDQECWEALHRWICETVQRFETTLRKPIEAFNHQQAGA